jgi:hypothetical protein
MQKASSRRSSDNLSGINSRVPAFRFAKRFGGLGISPPLPKALEDCTDAGSGFECLSHPGPAYVAKAPSPGGISWSGQDANRPSGPRNLGSALFPYRGIKIMFPAFLFPIPRPLPQGWGRGGMAFPLSLTLSTPEAHLRPPGARGLCGPALVRDSSITTMSIFDHVISAALTTCRFLR